MTVSATSSTFPEPIPVNPGQEPPRQRIDRFRLTGTACKLDPRNHAIRRDIADVALAHLHFAPHYAQAVRRSCIMPAASVHSEAHDRSVAVSQLLHGEDFAVLEFSRGWAWGYSVHDRYVGYVHAGALGETITATHMINVPAALIFADRDIRSEVRSILPIGAKIAGSIDGDFLETGSGFIHRRHVVSQGKAADPVAIAEILLGQPYRWGGRGWGGVDCSGLVQLALGMCGVSMPRDSDQQCSIGEDLAPHAQLRRGDLVFFPGHVGLMSDGETLVHANAHWMRVTAESLADVVARLEPAYERPVLARRRLSL